MGLGSALGKSARIIGVFVTSLGVFAFLKVGFKGKKIVDSAFAMSDDCKHGAMGYAMGKLMGIIENLGGAFSNSITGIKSVVTLAGGSAGGLLGILSAVCGPISIALLSVGSLKTAHGAYSFNKKVTKLTDILASLKIDEKSESETKDLKEFLNKEIGITEAEIASIEAHFTKDTSKIESAKEHLISRKQDALIGNITNTVFKQLNALKTAVDVEQKLDMDKVTSLIKNVKNVRLKMLALKITTIAIFLLYIVAITLMFTPVMAALPWLPCALLAIASLVSLGKTLVEKHYIAGSHGILIENMDSFVAAENSSQAAENSSQVA